MEFTRTGGDCDVNPIITAGGHHCGVLLSIGHGEASGLDRVDGKRPWDNGSPAFVRPGALVNGRRYRLLVNVRVAQPDHASIDVSLDGKPYFPHWEGDPASFSIFDGWQLPDTRELALATWSSRVTFHSMRLKLLAGQAINLTSHRTSQTMKSSPSGGVPVGAVVLFTFDKNSFFQRDGKWYVKDMSGHGNDGLVNGTTSVQGRVGDALSFRGKDDYVECVNSESLSFNEGITVGAWIKVRGWRERTYIVSKDDWNDGHAHGFVLRGDEQVAGRIDFTIGARDDWRQGRSEGKLDLDQWHHVVATNDGRSTVVYLDGRASGSSIAQGPITPSNYNLRIGSGAFAPDRDFDGVIDEVAIFQRALSEREVQRLYAMGQRGQSLAASKRFAPSESDRR